MPLTVSIDKRRERGGGLEAGDVKGFDVPNSGALLGGLAEEEANLLEGLGEGEFGGHFEGFGAERRRGGGGSIGRAWMEGLETCAFRC